MKLLLVDTNRRVTDAWQILFREEPDVEVYCDKFQAITKYDAIVSPANSFGIMDGGFDLALKNYFGVNLVARVQNHIKNWFFGEQPVGTSFITETLNEQHPYLVHAPTMRTPGSIVGTNNVYFAMLSILQSVKHHNKIETLLCPGLGALAGGLSGPECAEQMYAAYINFRASYEQPKTKWSDFNDRRIRSTADQQAG